MEKYFLLQESSDKVEILDSTIAKCYGEANEYFKEKGWTIGTVLSKEDWEEEIAQYYFEMKNDNL